MSLLAEYIAGNFDDQTLKILHLFGVLATVIPLASLYWMVFIG